MNEDIPAETTAADKKTSPIFQSGKVLGAIFRILVTIAILIFLAKGIDWVEFYNTVASANIQKLLFPFAIILAVAFINSLRWQILAGVTGIKVPWYRYFKLYLIGFFFNNLFVAGTGEAKRILDLGKETGKTPEAFISVAGEKWTGMMALLLLSILTLPLSTTPEKRLLFPVLTFAFIVFLSLFVILGLEKTSLLLKISFFKKYEEPILQLEKSIVTFKNRNLPVISAILLAIIAYVLVAVSYFLISISINSKVGFYPFFIFTPSVTIISQLPITINGIGAQDASYIYLLQPLGVPRYEAFLISILYHAIKLGIGIIGGLIYLIESIMTNREAVRRSRIM